jgi:ATP-dependent exoDNAse (exonuclease V) alpha subunit
MDVAHAEIVLPAVYADRVDMEWALDRSRLWNAAEHSGRQWNSRLAREVLVHVPPELTPAQRTQLVRGFSRELADRYGNAVDFAIHVPRPQADQRHHHAHLLMTTRQVGPDGLGARTSLDLSGTERRARGLGHSKDELLWIRERWAQVTNEVFFSTSDTVSPFRSAHVSGAEIHN